LLVAGDLVVEILSSVKDKIVEVYILESTKNNTKIGRKCVKRGNALNSLSEPVRKIWKIRIDELLNPVKSAMYEWELLNIWLAL
jgi:hypothetical protein